MLALTQPAEAKIVYTKAHHRIGATQSYDLDLNKDGLVDFAIGERSSSQGGGDSWNELAISPVGGNAVEGAIACGFLGYYRCASALKPGTRVGPRQTFSSHSHQIMAQFGCSDGGCTTIGQWANVKNRYLGLKFHIGKAIHYGWARMSVSVQKLTITATLTGYAYETVPNKWITTGETKGPDVIKLEPGAL